MLTLTSWVVRLAQLTLFIPHCYLLRVRVGMLALTSWLVRSAEITLFIPTLHSYTTAIYSYAGSLEVRTTDGEPQLL